MDRNGTGMGIRKSLSRPACGEEGIIERTKYTNIYPFLDE